MRVTTSRGRPASRVRALGVPGAGELRVRLVDDDDGALRGGVHGLDDVERQGGAGGVVRRAEEDDVRLVLADLLDRGLHREVERCVGPLPRSPSTHVVPTPVLMSGCIE